MSASKRVLIVDDEAPIREMIAVAPPVFRSSC
jgi:CheY-like chemotaxis protein